MLYDIYFCLRLCMNDILMPIQSDFEWTAILPHFLQNEIQLAGVVDNLQPPTFRVHYLVSIDTVPSLTYHLFLNYSNCSKPSARLKGHDNQ